jgi:hypothetical protein
VIVRRESRMEPMLHRTDADSCPKEELRLLAWRREQLLALGASRSLANAYAELVDWHEVSALVEQGCPPDLALEIVR